MCELPEGWKPIRLRDTGVWLSGGTPSTDEPRFWDGDIPWISAASMKNFYINDSDRKLTKSGSSAGTRMVGRGSVIFVVRGMSLKKEFRVGVAQRELAFGQDCKAIIPRQDIDGTFLAWALKVRESRILSMVDEAGHGTGRLPTDMISRLEIGIPPMPQQRRIIEILNAVDARISATALILDKLHARAHGVVEDLLSSVSVEKTPLGAHLASPPKNGFSPKEVEGWTGLQAIGLGCLTPDGFEPRQLKNVPARDGRNTSALLNDGDLLMSRANTRDLVGLAGVYRDIGAPCIYPDLMMRLTPVEYCRAAYLELLLRSNDVRRQIQGFAQGTSESMVKLSGASVRHLRLAVPPLVEQERILAIVSAVRLEIDEQKRERHALLRLKEGLAEDLLTGRVRVPEAEAILENL